MRRGIVVLFLCLGVGTFAQEGRPDTLAAVVPDGAVFVVRGNNLIAAYGALAGTPLAKAVCQGPLARFLEESGKLEEIAGGRRQFETVFGFDPVATATQLASKEIVLAVYPRAGQEPEVALLMRGEDGLDAAPLVERVLNAFVMSGELTAVPPDTAEAPPYKVFRNRRGDTVVFAAHGPHSMVANSLDLAKKIVDLAGGKGGASLLDNPRLRDTCRDLVEDAEIATFLNVQALRAAIPFPDEALPPQARFVAAIAKAVKGIGSAIHVHGNGLSGRTRIAFDEDALPDILQRWHHDPAQASSFARSLPRDGVVGGMVFHIYFGALAQAILKGLPEGTRATVEGQLAGVDSFFLGGKSLVNDLLPAIGPEIAIVLTDLDQTDRVPADVSLLLQIRKEDGKTILGSVVRSLYGLTQLMGNPDEAAKHALAEADGMLILSKKENDFTPAVAVTPSALILSTSAEVTKRIAGWLAAPPAENLGDAAPAFKGTCMGVNLAAFGQWLVRSSDFIAIGEAKKRGVPVDEVKVGIVAAGEFLAQFDALVAHGVSKPGAFEMVAELKVGN